MFLTVLRELHVDGTVSLSGWSAMNLQDVYEIGTQGGEIFCICQTEKSHA